MRTALALLPLLLTAGAPPAAQLEVRGAADYAPHAPIVLTAAGSNPGDRHQWEVSAPARSVAVGDRLHVWAPPGHYRVRLVVEGPQGRVEAGFNFRVQGEKPEPPPAAPQKALPPSAAGLEVLIVYQAGQPLTHGQHEVITGRAIREYLDRVCAQEPGGKARAWRIWPRNVDTRNTTARWKDTLGRAPARGLPWLIARRPDQATPLYEGPLPDGVAAVENLLNALAGRKATRVLAD